MPSDIVAVWTQFALLEEGVVMYGSVEMNGVFEEILSFTERKLVSCYQNGKNTQYLLALDRVLGREGCLCSIQMRCS